MTPPSKLGNCRPPFWRRPVSAPLPLLVDHLRKSQLLTTLAQTPRNAPPTTWSPTLGPRTRPAHTGTSHRPTAIPLDTATRSLGPSRRRALALSRTPTCSTKLTAQLTLGTAGTLSPSYGRGTTPTLYRGEIVRGRHASTPTRVPSRRQAARGTAYSGTPRHGEDPTEQYRSYRNLGAIRRTSSRWSLARVPANPP